MKNTISRRTYHTVGIGELLWDMLPEGKRLGGAPANFALHSSALGGQAAIISSLGHDNDATEILQQLSEKQIDTAFIQTSRYPTGRVDAQVCKEGLPTYLIQDNVAWDYIQHSEEMKSLAKTCDAVCFGSLAQRHSVSRKSIHQFLSNTNVNCLRVFDINLRLDYYTPEIIDKSLRAANVLKLNDDELVVLSDLFKLSGSTDSALLWLLNHYDLDLVAFTQGAKGSLMIDRKEIYHCPGMSVTVKDTIGAGDSFTATMVMGILYGLPPERINRLAGKVAAYVCSQAGATPSLPAGLIAELKQEMPIPICEIADTVTESGLLNDRFNKASQPSL